MGLLCRVKRVISVLLLQSICHYVIISSSIYASLLLDAYDKHGIFGLFQKYNPKHGKICFLKKVNVSQ